MVDSDQTRAIFSEGFNGAIYDIIHTYNCYWNVDGGDINLGLSTYGDGEINANPLFVNYTNGNYALKSESPVRGWGSMNN